MVEHLTERESLLSTIVVAKAALVYSNEILLVRRSNSNKTDVGEWEFPGGKREMGEPIDQVIKRELEEEIGYEGDIELPPYGHIGERLEADRQEYRGIAILTITKVVNLDEKPQIILSTEHDEYRWVTKEDALKLNTREATRKVLEADNFTI